MTREQTRQSVLEGIWEKTTTKSVHHNWWKGKEIPDKNKIVVKIDESFINDWRLSYKKPLPRFHLIEKGTEKIFYQEIFQ